MTDSEKLDLIRTEIEVSDVCLCGTFESCEVCNEYSAVNRLRKKVRRIIDCHTATTTVAEYGAHVQISLDPLT